MRFPRFLLLVAICLPMAGASPALAAIDPPKAPSLRELRPEASPASASAPAPTLTPAMAAVAGGALSLLSPGHALARLAAALDAAITESGIIEAAASSLDPACPTPENIEIVDNFGEWRGSHRHTGVDIRAAHGSLVRAVSGSTVESVGYDGAYGLLVTTRDNDGDLWLYAHLSSATVEVGEIVEGGADIGAVGCTGRCSGPHLHLERRPQGGAPVDTYDLLVKACG